MQFLRWHFFYRNTLGLHMYECSFIYIWCDFHISLRIKLWILSTSLINKPYIGYSSISIINKYCTIILRSSKIYKLTIIVMILMLIIHPIYLIWIHLYKYNDIQFYSWQICRGKLFSYWKTNLPRHLKTVVITNNRRQGFDPI